MLENAFNRVWKVKRDRSIVRRMIDYVAIVFLGPIFFAVVLATISLLTRYLRGLARGFLFSMGVPLFLNFAGFLIIILLFTCIYIIVPNTKVKFKPALVAGIATTIMFYILKFIFFHVQSSISKYNAIYGSLSFIPIFLIWVQYIWMSVLVGAQISFSSQNLEKYSVTRNADEMPVKLKKELSILVIYCMLKKFHEAEAPYSSRELAKELGVEVPLMRDILNGLEDIELINEIVNNSDDDKYQISVDPAVLTLEMLLNKIEVRNTNLYEDVEISKKYKPILKNIQKDIIYKNEKLVKDIEK